MIDPKPARTKKKITYTALQQGIQKAENALKRFGFESKSNFAASQLLSRTTVTKFFNCQPIQLNSFKRICEALELNWTEIAGIIKEEQLENSEINIYSMLNTCKEVEAMQTLERQITVIDKETEKVKMIITLKGDIYSINDVKIIELILKQYSGDSINIVDIQKGSIRLILEGSQADIKQLVSHIQSGEITELSGFPIEDIQILKESLDDENNELNDKWHLVQEIVNKGGQGKNLSGTDLSDADLRGVNLSDADLSDADLRGADLRGADLRGVNLSDADLRGTDLRGTDLSDADLSDADLSDADLRGADLRGADLSDTDLRIVILSNTDLINLQLAKKVQLVLPEAFTNIILSGSQEGLQLIFTKKEDDKNAISSSTDSKEAAPNTFADLVLSNMEKLKRCGIRNLEALAKGEILPKPGDFAIITSVLGISDEERTKLWQETYKLSVYPDAKGVKVYRNSEGFVEG
jgi:uncharacterized protein YjbI with pentapeptide repeats